MSPGWSGFWLRQRCLSQTCATRSQPCPAGLLTTPPDTPSRLTGSTHPRTRRTRRGPANPFLESPADSGTRAPNLKKLRQAGDARQALVRISEGTTKCGDCGDESAGDAEVSKI